MTVVDQQDNVAAWLTQDDHHRILNGVLILAATSLALALSSCLWRTKHPSQHSAHLQDHPSSILTAALSSLHILQSQPSECSMASTSQKFPLSDTLAPHDGDQKERKSIRSKERRRRGKDPLKDLFKGGKKSKALLKSIKTTENENEHDEHAYSTPAPSSELDQQSSTLGVDSSSATSRSASPDVSRNLGLLNPSSDDGVRNILSSGHMPIPFSGDASDHSPSSHSSHTDDNCHVLPEAELSSSTIPMPVPDTSLSSSATHVEPTDSRASQPRNSQAESTSGSSTSKPIRIRAKLRPSRINSSAHLPASLSAPDKVPSQVSTPSPPCPTTVSCPAISTASSSTNYFAAGAGPSTPTNSRGPTPSPCRSPERSPSPSQVPGQMSSGSQDTSPVSAQTQLASMRGALEAARLREEKLRAEAEQANKERDELCWRWNEDTGAWRRREAELQAQIHHLMHQLQAYAAVASFQAQQAQALQTQTRPNSGFSSPTSPHPHSSPRLHHPPLLAFPVPLSPLPPQPPQQQGVQPQNAASAPAHVQALLATAPMLGSHHAAQVQGFGMGVGGYSNAPTSMGAGMAMSPLLWSGLGLNGLTRDSRNGGHRTPDSCASGSGSGSSSRGRRRRKRAEEVKSASDESSLGDWEGPGGVEDEAGEGGDRWYHHDGEGYDEEEEEANEWEEDMLRKHMLADAILKRPESIRGLSRVGKRASGSGLGLGRVSSRASVRSEPASLAPVLTPLTNGHGHGHGVDGESERESGGRVPPTPPRLLVDNLTIDTALDGSEGQ